MYKIEIYEKQTKKVIETKKVNNLEGFMLYWAMQCDDKNYDYKIKNEVKK